MTGGMTCKADDIAHVLYGGGGGGGGGSAFASTLLLHAAPSTAHTE